MTIYEYNKNFYPKYSAACCMLNNIEHALAKCENPEDVKYQFSCIGLNEDTINFLIEAINYYREGIKNKAIKESVGCDVIY